MKYHKIILALCSVMMLFSAKISLAQNQNPAYDSALAKQLGADDYGMKPYIFVILRSGSNKSTNKALRDSCFAGHMANISAMVKEKKLIVAGPMDKNEEDIRGIFILDVSTIEAAETILKNDLAISNNFLQADIFLWYGSAALSAYLPYSGKIWKIKP